MRAYIDRARNHDEFMKIQNQEYKIGKRHLANMMGEDPETFTQEDVDVSELNYEVPLNIVKNIYFLFVSRMLSSICFRPGCTTSELDR